MNDIPLLKRRIDADINDCFQDKDGNVLLFSDVVNDLRKYKKYEYEMFKYFKKYPEEIMIFIKSENELFQILNNCGSKQCEGVMYDDYINEFNNWLWNKIIGKLPEEKELSKK